MSLLNEGMIMEENKDVIVCPRCGKDMLFHGVTRHDELGNKVSIFECENCHKIKGEILS